MTIKKAQQGFTLLELMVVVAVIGILASIAYPSYTDSILKTRRTTAKACLSEYANFMERFYTTNLAYHKDQSGTDIVIPALGCTTEGELNKFYTFAVTNITRNTFQATATPTTRQKDALCGTLSLDQVGNRTVSVTTTPAEKCW